MGVPIIHLGGFPYMNHAASGGSSIGRRAASEACVVSPGWQGMTDQDRSISSSCPLHRGWLIHTRWCPHLIAFSW